MSVCHLPHNREEKRVSNRLEQEFVVISCLVGGLGTELLQYSSRMASSSAPKIDEVDIVSLQNEL